MTRDRTQPLHLRVFIASPGDVAEERAAAREIVDRLPQDPLLRGRVTTQSVAWGEPGGDLPLPATSSPQAAIAAGLPRPRDCDLCLVILWARMGTPLDPAWETKPDGTPYASGTEWEYLDARAGHAEHGRPEILIYRRTQVPSIALTDAAALEKLAQYQAVETFCAQLKNPDGSWSGAVNGYSDPDEFKARLANDLRAVVNRLLEAPKAPNPAERLAASAGASDGARIAAAQGGIVTGTVSDSALVTGIGNVVILGSTQVHTGPAAPDAGHLERAYLEQLARVSRRLERQGGSGASLSGEERTRLKLDAVYTALLTRTPRPDPDPKGRGREAAHPEDSVPEARPPLSALEMLDRERRLVLLGEAGSGKSTFLDFVALCLAGERLVWDHGADDLPGLGLLTASLPGDDGEPGETPQPWRHGPRLPVLVTLRHFAAECPWPESGRIDPHTGGDLLWGYIAKSLGETRAAYAEPLKRHLQKEGGLILFDGLDEVPKGPERRRVQRAIDGFMDSFGPCRAVIASRTYSFRDDNWRPDGFAETELANLGQGQIRQFVRRWYAHAAERGVFSPDHATGLAADLERAIFGRVQLQELAERPLLLTLMARLHQRDSGQLPDERASLYEESVKLLLEDWEQSRVVLGTEGQVVLCQPSLTEFLNVGSRQIRGLLERLALAAHERQSLEEGGGADIEAREARRRTRRPAR